MFYYQTTSVVIYVLFPLLTSLAVGFRIFARRTSGTPFGADDWLVFAAMIMNIGNSVYDIVSIYTIDYEGLIIGTNLHQYWETTYIETVLPTAIVGIIKCSVILFYKRIFETRTFRIAANIVLAICTAWTVATILTSILRSYPISNYRDVDFSSNINFGLFELITSILDLVLDLLVLSLPLPVTRKLHMSTRKRLAVGAIFGLGIFCVVAVSIRLVYFVQLSTIADDATAVLEDPERAIIIQDASILWSHIECSTSIIAACLPMLAPVFARFKTIILSPSSWTRLTRKMSKESASDMSSDRKIFERPKADEKDCSPRQEFETER